MRNWLFMNKELGTVQNYVDSMTEYIEMYDGGDPTNPMRFEDYYKHVGFESEIQE